MREGPYGPATLNACTFTLTPTCRWKGVLLRYARPDPEREASSAAVFTDIKGQRYQMVSGRYPLSDFLRANVSRSP